MHHTLESSKFFPLVAWTVVIFFTLFTYILTLHATKEIDTIYSETQLSNEQVTHMEQKRTPPQ